MFKKIKFINVLLIVSVVLLFAVLSLAAISQLKVLRGDTNTPVLSPTPMEEYVPVDPNLSSPVNKITPESLTESLESLEL